MDMDFQMILQNVLYLVIVGVLPLTVRYLTLFLKAKVNEYSTNLESKKMKEYLDTVTDALITAVNYTNQTYVDSLKERGEFTKEAQKEALNRTLETAKALITEDAQKAIEYLYNDYETYILASIETITRDNKITV